MKYEGRDALPEAPRYLFVEGHDAEVGEDPGGGGRQQLGVGPAGPLQHARLPLRVAAAQRRVGHCNPHTRRP